MLQTVDIILIMTSHTVLCCMVEQTGTYVTVNISCIDMAVSTQAPAPVMVIIMIYRIPTKRKFCKQRTNGRNPETMTCTSCLCAQQPSTFH